MVYGKTKQNHLHKYTLIGKYTLNRMMNLALTIRHYWVMQTITNTLQDNGDLLTNTAYTINQNSNFTTDLDLSILGGLRQEISVYIVTMALFQQIRRDFRSIIQEI
jgi:hypothetical protein